MGAYIASNAGTFAEKMHARQTVLIVLVEVVLQVCAAYTSGCMHVGVCRCVCVHLSAHAKIPMPLQISIISSIRHHKC